MAIAPQTVRRSQRRALDHRASVPRIGQIQICAIHGRPLVSQEFRDANRRHHSRCMHVANYAGPAWYSRVGRNATVSRSPTCQVRRPANNLSERGPVDAEPSRASIARRHALHGDPVRCRVRPATSSSLVYGDGGQPRALGPCRPHLDR